MIAPTRWFDDLLTVERPRAAGNLAAFRIVYALFYLWHLGTQRVDWAAAPDIDDEVWLFFATPVADASVLRLLEAVLVAALVGLAFGLRTRLTTAVVLVVGTYLDAGLTNLDHEHGTAILVFWIPAVMLLFDGWGDCRGIDAARLGRPVDPGADSWRYTIGPRVLLVVLSILFFTAGFWKFGVGSWLTNGDQMRNIVREADLIAALHQLPENPLSGVMSSGWVHQPLRLGVPLYEALFFVALANRATERLMVSTAMVLHATSALFLAVTFTPLIVVYAAFVDWERLLSALPRSGFPWHRFEPAVAILAVGAAIAWHQTGWARNVLDVGDRIDFRTIFFPLLPISLVGLALAAADVSRLRRPRGA